MPKTAEQERLEGYPGHRPVNGSAPVPDSNIPPAPKWLGKIATRHYYDLARRLGNDGMRVLGASDTFALAMVCDTYEEYRKCRDILEEEGPYFQSGRNILNDEGDIIGIDNLQKKRHPAVGDKQNAWSRYMTGLGKFGLTPYERQKVSVISDDKPVQSRDDILAEKRKKALEAAKNKSHIRKVVNE
jgi:P27 family predicted phage terminase small subunit